jgi:hypothetical protein
MRHRSRAGANSRGRRVDAHVEAVLVEHPLAAVEGAQPGAALRLEREEVQAAWKASPPRRMGTRRSHGARDVGAPLAVPDSAAAVGADAGPGALVDERPPASDERYIVHGARAEGLALGVSRICALLDEQVEPSDSARGRLPLTWARQ